MSDATEGQLPPGRKAATAVTSPWEVGTVHVSASAGSEHTMAVLTISGLLVRQLLCRLSLSEEFEVEAPLEGGLNSSIDPCLVGKRPLLQLQDLEAKTEGGTRWLKRDAKRSISGT